jgi:hypothetical protein
LTFRLFSLTGPWARKVETRLLPLSPSAHLGLTQNKVGGAEAVLEGRGVRVSTRVTRTPPPYFQDRAQAKLPALLTRRKGECHMGISRQATGSCPAGKSKLWVTAMVGSPWSPRLGLEGAPGGSWTVELDLEGLLAWGSCCRLGEAKPWAEDL